MDDKFKVSVVVPAEEFERFDSYCAEKGFKKSTLIVRLIREHMDREGYRVQGLLPLSEPQQLQPGLMRRARRPATRGA